MRVWRRGKLLGIEVEGDLTLVIHLMQAGRLGHRGGAHGPARDGPPRSTWRSATAGRGPPARVLRLRELSSKRRASAHLLDAAGLAAHRPLTRLGPEPIGLSPAQWREVLAPGRRAAHRAARRPPGGRHRARLRQRHHVGRAPRALRAHGGTLTDDDLARLAPAADTVLGQALERARERITTDLPNKEARVTAVHGHHGEPCLRCGTTLEHVAFEEYDLVYCPTCQTDGRIYRDRRMSRFLT